MWNRVLENFGRIRSKSNLEYPNFDHEFAKQITYNTHDYNFPSKNLPWSQKWFYEDVKDLPPNLKPVTVGDLDFIMKNCGPKKSSDNALYRRIIEKRLKNKQQTSNLQKLLVGANPAYLSYEQEYLEFQADLEKCISTLRSTIERNQ